MSARGWRGPTRASGFARITFALTGNTLWICVSYSAALAKSAGNIIDGEGA